jgi:hypothetical protein
MSKTIRVSEDFHQFVEANKREGETMEETLIRLTGGPDPEIVAGVISDESGRRMKDAIDAKSAADTDAKADLRDRFDDP